MSWTDFEKRDLQAWTSNNGAIQRPDLMVTKADMLARSRHAGSGAPQDEIR